MLIYNSLPMPTPVEWIMSLCLPGSPFFTTKVPFNSAAPRRSIYWDGGFIRLRVAKRLHEAHSGCRSLWTSERDCLYTTVLCNWRLLCFKQYLYLHAFGGWWKRVLYSRVLWWRVLQCCLHISSVSKSLLWVSSAVGMNDWSSGNIWLTQGFSSW